MRIFKHILLSLLLMILAIVLFAVLLIPAFIAAVISFFLNKKIGDGFQDLGNLFLSTAIAIDQMGNTFCAALFNYTLQKNGYPFGNVDETISGVLGKNKVQGTLTKTGKALDFILESLDPNHSINAIEEDEG